MVIRVVSKRIDGKTNTNTLILVRPQWDDSTRLICMQAAAAAADDIDGGCVRPSALT